MAGLCPKDHAGKRKICGAKQKSGLKPHPLVVKSLILANFSLYRNWMGKEKGGEKYKEEEIVIGTK